MSELSSSKQHLHWKLNKYARCQQQQQKQSFVQHDGNDDQWTVYDNCNSDLRLVLTSLRYILITSDEAIEESCYLWDKENIEAFSKGDSLLIIVKTPSTAAAATASATVEYVCRKFRVQFAASSVGKSALEQCADCVSHLSEYINVNQLPCEEQRHQLTAGSTRQVFGDNCRMTLTNYVAYMECLEASEAIISPSHQTLSELATQMFTGGLPEAYHAANCSNLIDDVAALLPLCLSDSNFASFVGQVEQKLKDFIDSD